MGLNLYSPTSSDAALPGASAANAVLSSAPVATSVVLLYAATKLSPPVSTTPKATIYASDSERILDEVDDLAAVGWRRRARVAVMDVQLGRAARVSLVPSSSMLVLLPLMLE